MQAENNNTIEALRIHNPFDPNDYSLERWELPQGATVGTFFPPVYNREGWLVLLNGQKVESADFDVAALAAGDQLVISPVPLGGGGGKNILRLVALIALSVAAPGIGGAMTGALWGSTGVLISGGTFAAGVMAAGSMLINALLPIRPNDTGKQAIEDSPTYGVDGAKNTSEEGIPVPVPYGTFRMAGNIIANYVENGTGAEKNTQYLYMLINAGEGPIAGISDIEINDQPISSFAHTPETQIRTGLPNQEMIPWFDDSVSPVSFARKLTPTDATYTTSQAVDKLRLDFVFPNGLGYINDNGSISKRQVKVYLDIKPKDALDSEYRPAGSYDGGRVASYHYYTYATRYIDLGGDNGGYNEKYITGEVVQSTLNPGDTISGDTIVRTTDYGGDNGWSTETVGKVAYASVKVPYVTFEDATRTTLRTSIMIDDLTEGFYTVRVRRENFEGGKTDEASEANASILDSVTLTDINEIKTEDVQYNNTALLGIKIKLDDQISQQPKVTFINGGRLIRVWDEAQGQFVTTASNNAAWVTLDAMTHRRYGGSTPDARIDIEKWREWARYCDANNLTFDGVFDTSSNIWDAMQHVARCGHAQIVPIGTRYSVVIEREDDPAMMFSVANMVKGSFSETFLPLTDRANEVEINFFDKDDGYKQRTVRVIDEEAHARGDEQKVSALTLYGVVDANKAWDEGTLQLRLNKYVLRTVSFTAPVEAIGCTVGSLVWVQHDMTQWGFSGRTPAGSTTTLLKLDREVEMQSGKEYRVVVHFDAVQRASGSVSAITGTTLGLTGFDGNPNVKRIRIGTVDKEVVAVVGLSVVVRDVAGLAVGQAYTLWDTDVLEERTVLNTGTGTYTELSLTSPLPAAPEPFRHFMFGELGKLKKPFRIKNISLSASELNRDITAIEYNPEVYTKGVFIPPPNYSSLPKIEHVTIDGVTEDVISAVSSNTSRVTVRFTGKGVFVKAHGWVSRDGRPWEDLSTALDRFTVDAVEGEELTFRILAMDALGASPPLSTAPIVTYTVQGFRPQADAVEITQPTGFSATGAIASIVLNWNAASADMGVGGVEIWRSTTSAFDNAVLVDSTEANHYTDTLGQTGQTYWYWIRFYSVGVNPVRGPFTASQSATTQAVQFADFADDIEPVRLVDALPESKVAEVVFLKSEQKLYSWNPDTGAYEPTISDAINAEDIIGKIGSDQIEPGAIDTDKFALNVDPVAIVDELPVPSTFISRASSGTYIDTDGVLKTADADVARYEDGKLLTEPEATNVILASEDIRSARGWNFWGLTSSADAGVAPDGANTAEQLLETAESSSHMVVRNTVPTSVGGSCAFSVFLKHGGRDLVQLSVTEDAAGFANSAVGIVSLVDGSVQTFVASGAFSAYNGSVNVRALANGWWRVELTTASPYSKVQVRVQPVLDVEGASDPYLGDVTKGVWAWGWQLEQGPKATSYIKTDTTAQTRAVDVAAVHFRPRVVMLTTDSKIYRLNTDTLQWERTTASEDIEGEITETQIADDAITTPKIRAGAIKADHISAGEVTTDAIAAGAVSAVKIAAGAITAEKLVLAARSLNTDPDFQLGALWTNFVRRLPRTDPAVPAGCPYEFAAEFKGRDCNGPIALKVEPGERYRATCWVSPGVTGAKSGIVAVFYDAANVYVTSQVAGTVALGPATWELVSTEFDVPDDTVKMFVGPWNSQAYDDTATSWFTELNFARMVSSELIVDGAVNADKIAANAVKAEHLDADSVTAGAIKAGAVGADQIAAGAVTASKMRITGGVGMSLWGDPNCEDPEMWEQSQLHPTAAKADFFTTTTGKTGNKTLIAVSSARSAVGTPRVAVASGRRYRISAYLRTQGGAGGPCYLRYVWGALPTGGYSEVTGGVEAVIPPTEWTLYSWEFVPPEEAKFIAPMVLLNWSAAGGNNQAQGIRIEEMVDSSLMVEGGIKADRIDARELGIKDANGNLLFGVGVPPPSGGNRVRNPCFLNGSMEGWVAGSYGLDATFNTVDQWSGTYRLNGNETAYIEIHGTYGGDPYYVDANCGVLTVQEGRWYQFSALVNPHRAGVQLHVHLRDINGSIISYGGYPGGSYVDLPQNGVNTATYKVDGGFYAGSGQSEKDYARVWATFQAPAGCTNIVPVVRAFAAPGAANPYLFFDRVQVCEIPGTTAGYVPFDAGAGIFSGAQKITGSNITTYIENAAIGNAQIGGVIQSDNYSPGAAGWAINKNTDYAEFGNVRVRGDVQANSVTAGSVNTLGIVTKSITNTVSRVTEMVPYKEFQEASSGEGLDYVYLGSVTTSPNGDGRVVIFISGNPKESAVSSWWNLSRTAYGAIASITGTRTVSFRVYRSSEIEQNWQVVYQSGKTIIGGTGWYEAFDNTTHVVDMSAPRGVTCNYYYAVYTYAPTNGGVNPASHRCEILPLTSTVVEMRR